jgi:glyceraldehyde-3-phosphate dehydrogenase (NAD(P))
MEKKKYKVLVNGMGNIGTSLIHLLLRYKNELHIEQIYAVKRSFKDWQMTEIEMLQAQGVIIGTISRSSVPNRPSLEDLLPIVDYIFEATANGVGLENLNTYQTLDHLLGASAQGSEKGFGTSFMAGINEEKIKNQRFVHVVSCNTHGSAALLNVFTGKGLENLQSADMVVVRRSEDIGNHQRLVSANVVARHLDHIAGTHHSIDVIDMYKTLGVECPLTSSDITTPSQLMHAVRFNIQLKEALSETPEELIKNQPFLSMTKKFDSNVVFELGRRYGFGGRIYEHAIVLISNLLISNKTIKGWAFVPQEGNTLLSTIRAFMLQVSLTDHDAVFLKIKTDLLKEQW